MTQGVKTSVNCLDFKDLELIISKILSLREFEVPILNSTKRNLK